MKKIYKLFNIHCGFYDHEISEGIYEFHINIPIVAQSMAEAKKLVRENHIFVKKKMHIDGIIEIQKLDGFRLELIPEQDKKQTIILNHLHRDL